MKALLNWINALTITSRDMDLLEKEYGVGFMSWRN
jgi:hypothetical protein